MIHECSILSVPADSENPRNRILLLRDVTERKQMEAELQRAKEKAEASDEAKGRFLAMMSHEIRTPMNGVLGFAEMLQKTPLNADQQEYVNLISHSSELLLVVINDILDYSKIEAGRIELDEWSFDLSAEIEKIHRLLTPQAKEKGLDFRWRIDPEVPPTLWGDSVRLGQILTNLLANALKFTPAGKSSFTFAALPMREKIHARGIRSSLKSGTRASACRRKPSSGFSNPSARRIHRPPASSAAPASAWRSRSA